MERGLVGSLGMVVVEVGTLGNLEEDRELKRCDTSFWAL